MTRVHLIHQLHDNNTTSSVNAEDRRVVWTTCRRSIGFDWSGIPNGALNPSEAHRLLLEVVCGLQSPVIGETEVHGQFKQFLEANKFIFPKNIYGDLFEIHLQARKIRDSYLRGLGTQSYGSFARKKLRGHKEINIWGSGHLAQEVLPWLAKLDARVRVWARCVEKANHLKAKHDKIELEKLGQLEYSPSGALVLAAPIESEQVSAHLDSHSWEPDVILDFRAESSKDPLPAEYEAMQLKEIFREIETVKSKMSNRVHQARAEIARIVQEQSLWNETQDSRP